MRKIDEKLVAEVVRKVLSEQGEGRSGENFVKHRDASGVLSVKCETVRPAPFDTGKPGDQVYLTDMLSLDENRRLGCGIMEMKETTFDWTLNYDEVDYVIEGTLEIVIDGRRVVGNKGDMIMIPRGTSIKFSVPDFARFMYTVYPADWDKQ